MIKKLTKKYTSNGQQSSLQKRRPWETLCFKRSSKTQFLSKIQKFRSEKIAFIFTRLQLYFLWISNKFEMTVHF